MTCTSEQREKQLNIEHVHKDVYQAAEDLLQNQRKKERYGPMDEVN